MEKLNPEYRALFLLCTIVAFIVLVPLLEGKQLGEFFLVVSMFLTLIAATLEVGGRKGGVLWGVTIPAGIAMVLIVLDYAVKTRVTLVAGHLMLAVFLGIVVVRLFSYLEKPGEITNSRLHISVSLYFLLGIFWFAVFTFLNAVRPGSYVESGTPLVARAETSKLLYFSLATLTTLGYGDVIAVNPMARILATLEAATGVLFIAITVARLVAAQQTVPQERK